MQTIKNINFFKTANLKPKNSKKEKNKNKKKTLFFKFWKLGTVYFCTVKTYFQFSKLGAGSGGQPSNFF